MTYQETGKILEFLAACYPAVHSSMSFLERRNALEVWQNLFDGEQLEFRDILSAAKRYVMGAESREYPTPGEIAELARSLNKKD